jgi:hypothetical protein
MKQFNQETLVAARIRPNEAVARCTFSQALVKTSEGCVSTTHSAVRRERFVRHVINAGHARLHYKAWKGRQKIISARRRAWLVERNEIREVRSVPGHTRAGDGAIRTNANRPATRPFHERSSIRVRSYESESKMGTHRLENNSKNGRVPSHRSESHTWILFSAS